VKLLVSSFFAEKNWTFHQNSASIHKAKPTPCWLEVNLPIFIAAQDWLLVLDYSLWSFLEKKTCSKPHRKIESLKVNLVKSQLPQYR
jgi:hypothetical protein